MKIKTSELINVALDWAVGLAEGYELRLYGVSSIRAREPGLGVRAPWRPSYYWDQGGPIIEREGIALWLSATPEKGTWASADKHWMDLDPDSDEFLAMPDPWHGPTSLIAAMRCYVASKLGDEVDVPETLS